ncbi:hypothetical protein RCH06_002385 [Polaromonas sp. CG_9.5]|nr:hypothetical protein [Polaromonas sp. CG_9.5]
MNTYFKLSKDEFLCYSLRHYGHGALIEFACDPVFYGYRYSHPSLLSDHQNGQFLRFANLAAHTSKPRRQSGKATQLPTGFTLNHHRRLPSTVSLHQAVGDSPSLARLTQLVRESNQRLQAIQALIPSGLRPAVKAGPIDGENWCLLVSGNAAAAKVRQLIPLMQASLLRQGWKVTTIRLKILFAKR